jgi:hypothetical protein
LTDKERSADGTDFAEIGNVVRSSPIITKTRGGSRFASIVFMILDTLPFPSSAASAKSADNPFT